MPSIFPASAAIHFNPIALRTAKTLWSFGRSECNRIEETLTEEALFVWKELSLLSQIASGKGNDFFSERAYSFLLELPLPPPKKKQQKLHPQLTGEATYIEKKCKTVKICLPCKHEGAPKHLK